MAYFGARAYSFCSYNARAFMGETVGHVSMLSVQFYCNTLSKPLRRGKVMGVLEGGKAQFSFICSQLPVIKKNHLPISHNSPDMAALSPDSTPNPCPCDIPALMKLRLILSTLYFVKPLPASYPHVMQISSPSQLKQLIII